MKFHSPRGAGGLAHLRLFIVSFVLLGCALLGTSVLPAGAAPTTGTGADSPAGSKLFGVNEPNSWRSSPVRATPTQLATQLADLHAESQRWQLDWQAVEPNPPLNGVRSYDFSAFDSMYQADLAAGIRPLIIVSNAPKWAWPTNAPTGPGSPGWGFPPGIEHRSDWEAFLAAVAGRYPQAAGIEIWNEPNHPAFWGRGYLSNAPDPAHYAWMLQSAYDAVKAVHPEMPVIGGSLANFQSTTSDGKISALEFATALFSAGAADYMDAISTHPYPQVLGPVDHTIFELGIDQMRQARATVGAATPIWLTELGVTTTGPTPVSEADQATILADAFSWLQTQPDIEAFYVHALTEPTQDTASMEMGYALMHGASAPFSPKPAYTALRDLAQGQVAAGGKSSISAHLPARQAVARRGRLRVRVGCPQGCAISAHASLSYKARGEPRNRYRMLPGTASVAAGKKTTLVLRMRRQARRRLRVEARSPGALRARVKLQACGVAAGSAKKQISKKLRR